MKLSIYVFVLVLHNKRGVLLQKDTEADKNSERKIKRLMTDTLRTCTVRTIQYY